MKSEIYFMRHGESEANFLGILCGSGNDVTLTTLGKQQAQATAQETIELSFDVIVTSPLKRAQETAQIMASLHPKAKLMIDSELMEQNYGLWEGRPFIEIKDQFLVNCNPPEGESQESFTQRLRAFKNKTSKFEGRILLVSHGGVGSHLMEEFGHTKRLINNAELIKLL